jgi:uncharacterized protein
MALIRYQLGMKFEYDLEKSRSNKEKHGIDFDEIQDLWDDPQRLEIPAKSTDEPRHLIIGVIREKHWSVVVTYRDEKVRLISARRSRTEEVKIYESD